MMEFILALILFFAIAFSVVKSAKEFEDYGRIGDYLIMGVTIWLVGSINKDSSVQIVGSCIWIYGLAILLYNHYKKGYEESR